MYYYPSFPKLLARVWTFGNQQQTTTSKQNALELKYTNHGCMDIRRQYTTVDLYGILLR